MSRQIFPPYLEELASEVRSRKADLPPDELMQMVAQCPPALPLADELIALSNRPVTFMWSPEAGSGLTRNPGAFVVGAQHISRLDAMKTSLKRPLIGSWTIIDDYQIWEARALGVDALILSPRGKDLAALQWLIENCREAGMEALGLVDDLTTLRQCLETDVKFLIIEPQRIDLAVVMGQLKRWGKGRIAIPALENPSLLHVGNLNSLGYNSFYLKTDQSISEAFMSAMDGVFVKRRLHDRSPLQKLWR